MSRTYRKAMVNLDRNDKPFLPRKVSWFYSEGEYYERCHTDYFSKRNQKFDHKPWNKSSYEYKKMMKKQRRAKERAKMHIKDYDNVPKFKNENDYNWN